MSQTEIDYLESGEGDVSERVVAAIAEELDVDPLALPPLYEAVDPDALNSLFEYSLSGEETGRITFEAAGCDVTVYSDGVVEVTSSVAATAGVDAAIDSTLAETSLD